MCVLVLSLLVHEHLKEAAISARSSPHISYSHISSIKPVQAPIGIVSNPQTFDLACKLIRCLKQRTFCTFVKPTNTPLTWTLIRVWFSASQLRLILNEGRVWFNYVCSAINSCHLKGALGIEACLKEWKLERLWPWPKLCSSSGEVTDPFMPLLIVLIVPMRWAGAAVFQGSLGGLSFHSSGAREYAGSLPKCNNNPIMDVVSSWPWL